MSAPGRRVVHEILATVVKWFEEEGVPLTEEQQAVVDAFYAEERAA